MYFFTTSRPSEREKRPGLPSPRGLHGAAWPGRSGPCRTSAARPRPTFGRDRPPAATNHKAASHRSRLIHRHPHKASTRFKNGRLDVSPVGYHQIGGLMGPKLLDPAHSIWAAASSNLVWNCQPLVEAAIQPTSLLARMYKCERGSAGRWLPRASVRTRPGPEQTQTWPYEERGPGRSRSEGL